jgi:hypothetical protein
MPSALPSAENIAITGVCLFRVARLASDCSPLGGNGSGYITTGIIDFTATPEIEEGQTLAPKNGCGTVIYRKIRQDRTVGYNVSGNLAFYDPEGKFQMFGGSVIYGAAGGDFENEVIGWAGPNYDAPESPGVYLEVITQRVGEGAGDCIESGTDRPTWQGFIFGKSLLVPGEVSLQDDVVNMPFTGKTSGNPNLFDGPWNDWPGQGYIPNSPNVEIGYTDAQFDAILATAAAGQADLPTAS